MEYIKRIRAKAPIDIIPKAAIPKPIEQQELIFAIDVLAEECHNIAKDKGFWADGGRQIGTMIALVHSELSEALEADRKNLMDDKLPHRRGLEVELADAAIRIFDMAKGLNLDISNAIIEKLEFNKGRPHMHGSNRY